MDCSCLSFINKLLFLERCWEGMWHKINLHWHMMINTLYMIRFVSFNVSAWLLKISNPCCPCWCLDDTASKICTWRWQLVSISLNKLLCFLVYPKWHIEPPTEIKRKKSYIDSLPFIIELHPVKVRFLQYPYFLLCFLILAISFISLLILCCILFIKGKQF